MALETIWFFIWGLLWAVFFMTDGFDFGTGTLYPFLGKNDTDKRIMINAIGPLWDGNEVWLITAGGVTFAAFPKVYAVMFSTLYTPLMLILFALILRGVSFEFRSKMDHPGWRRIWDMCIFIGSAVPAVLFGVAFANIFRGIPFDGQGLYHGSLLMLLTPYGLLGGLLFLLLFMVHGACWLAIRTEGDLQERAVSAGKKTWRLLVPAAGLFLIASAFATDLYQNYARNTVLYLILCLMVSGLFLIKYFLTRKQWLNAWYSSALTIVSTTFFGIAGLFPALYPSSIDPEFTLTAFNASSSPLTLKIMLVVVIIFVPVVIAYQTWAYRLFMGKVDPNELKY